MYDFKKYLNCSYHLQSDYLQGIYKLSSLKYNAYELITSKLLIIELNVVSGFDLCLGPKTVSLPVSLSNCIGELIKIHSQISYHEEVLFSERTFI